MALVNSCTVNATTTGTGTFSLGPQALGGLTPLLAGAINGAKHTYRAFLPDLSQWEDGIGLYNTQINPSFESVDNTSAGGFGGTSPLTFHPPPTFSNGDLIAGFLGLPVTTGTLPGPLGITGSGWNIVGPALYAQGSYDQYVWFLWKVAASEPASYTVTWNNSDGLFQFWLMAAFETGGSTPNLNLANYNGQGVTSQPDSILAQSNLPGGIELRLMCQFNFGGTIGSTPQSADFTSITPYTSNGDQPAFGYAIYNNANSAPAIVNTNGPYTGFSGAAVFTFSGNPDTLSRDLVLKSSAFNQLVSFPTPPIIALTPGAHEVSGQLPVFITTASYTVQPTDRYLVYRGPAPGLLTLPTASQWPGRDLSLRNETNFVVLSASGNVVPASGGAASNALLPLNAKGTWVDLKSNQTAWEAELTNAGQFGTLTAFQVYATPTVLPSNDLALIANPINHASTNPFTASIALGAASGPFVVVIVPSAQSSDTVTIGGVTIPFVAAATEGCIFMGRVTGLSGTQTLSVNSLTWLETVVGVWLSQFDWVLQSVAGQRFSLSGSIAAAANSVLLGCFDVPGATGGGPPGVISFSGSTASPTSSSNASFDGTGTGFAGLQTCSASWNISSAETFNLVFSSSGAGVNNNWIMCNLTLAPAQPGFRFLVAGDLPLITSTPVLTSALPSAATAGSGARAYVTDATAPTFSGTLTGSGTVPSPVYSDGTNWRTG